MPPLTLGASGVESTGGDSSIGACLRVRITIISSADMFFESSRTRGPRFSLSSLVFAASAMLRRVATAVRGLWNTSAVALAARNRSRIIDSSNLQSGLKSCIKLELLELNLPQAYPHCPPGLLVSSASSGVLWQASEMFMCGHPDLFGAHTLRPPVGARGSVCAARAVGGCFFFGRGRAFWRRGSASALPAARVEGRGPPPAATRTPRSGGPGDPPPGDRQRCGIERYNCME